MGRQLPRHNVGPILRVGWRPPPRAPACPHHTTVQHLVQINDGRLPAFVELELVARSGPPSLFPILLAMLGHRTELRTLGSSFRRTGMGVPSKRRLRLPAVAGGGKDVAQATHSNKRLTIWAADGLGLPGLVLV